MYWTPKMAVKSGLLQTMKLNVDGASKNNPGLSGVGWLLKTPKNLTVIKKSKFIGEFCRSDVAEYQAFIHGLKDALLAGYLRLQAYTDSMLVYNQIKGLSEVKPGHVLQPLYQKAGNLIKKCEAFEILHIRRKYNRDADTLANEAIRRYRERRKV